jgi:type I restriction enzyme, S subunit
MRDGWIKTTLGETCKDGLFTDGDWVESKDQDPEGDYRLLQLADIGDGIFLNKSDRWMNKEQFNRLGCTKLEINDVLIARMPDPIGRACLFPRGLPGSATVVDVAIVRTGNEILQRILALIVNSQEFRNEAVSLLTGTTRQRISRGNLSNISFWLPPVSEQKRIVDLITSVDAYIEGLQQQLDSAKKSRNAVLHELLTAGGDDWEESSLGKLLTLEYGKPLTDENRDGKGFPVFASAGVVGLHSEPLVLNSPVIIVGRKGTAGAVHWSGTPCFVIDTAYFVKPITDIDLRFLYLLLGFIDLKSVTAQTGVPGLNRDRAYSLKCKVPPISTQLEVVTVITQLDHFIDSTQGSINRSQDLRSGLLSDLLSGEHEIPASYDKVIGDA